MKIWIDGKEANVPQRLGSSQVAFELIKGIAAAGGDNDYTVVLPGEPLGDMPTERNGFKYRILRPNKLWTRIALPLALYKEKNKPDVIFSPTHYIPRFSPVARVVTIFDLAYLHYPQMFTKKDLWQLTNWSRYSILHADHIVTISNATKKDLLKNYSVDKNKITVAYPGYNSSLFYYPQPKHKIDPILSKYKIEGEYVVYTGTIQPRKNLIRLIEAFKRIDNLKLVIVGKTRGEGREGWMYDEILAKPRELGIEDRVIFTGFMPAEDLPFIVAGAKAFILVSLWEGFGIPVIEAMACGVPVVVSNISSLPEITGDAGLLVNPESVEQIEQAIRTITTDKKLHAKLSKRSLFQAQRFNWKKCTKEVIKVLESV